MNSLGAGGKATPHLLNASNALTFCLMVLSCYFSSVIVHYIGIKGALIFGTYDWLHPGLELLTHDYQDRLSSIRSRVVYQQSFWN